MPSSNLIIIFVIFVMFGITVFNILKGVKKTNHPSGSTDSVMWSNKHHDSHHSSWHESTSSGGE